MKTGKDTLKVVELFSGIGAQAKALERIGNNYEIINTCDWDVGAIIAYCQIHKGKIDLDKYQEVTDQEIDSYLRSLTLSMDGKKPASEKTIDRMPSEVKRLIYTAVRETNNYVSITDVHGSDISEETDLMTYSFPCQDLSMCGYWHGNKSGIARGVNNRSGMLWEVERILKEMKDAGRTLPTFLVMENVTNILSVTHRRDFGEWRATLDSLGYFNKIYRLNAKNFGVPQKRERAYMISIFYGHDLMKYMQLQQFFDNNNLEDLSIAARYRERIFKLKDVLRLDYSQQKYLDEANANQPNDTPSRTKILHENDMLFDGNRINEIPVNTVTTKQDRNPNSGLITFDNGIEGKTKWRYLTPRECFLLMGFDEEDFERAVSINPEYSKDRKLLSNEKMIRMAGNSICVDVIEAIFKQIIEIDHVILKK